MGCTERGVEMGMMDDGRGALCEKMLGFWHSGGRATWDMFSLDITILKYLEYILSWWSSRGADPWTLSRDLSTTLYCVSLVAGLSLGWISALGKSVCSRSPRMREVGYADTTTKPSSCAVIRSMTAKRRERRAS